MTPKRFLSADAGWATPFSLYFLLGLLLVGGLAIDTSRAYHQRTVLMAAADSAVLASAQELPDAEAARAVGLQYIETFFPPDRYGTVATADDFVFGRWDPETGILDTEAEMPDAVALHARFSNAEGYTSLRPHFILSMFGIADWEISAQPIAHAGFRVLDEDEAGPIAGCNGGMFAKEDLETGSSNQFHKDFCLHGNIGVKTGSSNFFGEDVKVTMHDLSTLDVGSSNTGIYQAASEGTHDFTMLPQIDVMINRMRAADFSALPPFITKGPVYMDRIRNNDVLVPGTLYIVSGTVATKSGATWSDVDIVAGGNVSIGSDNSYWNVVIATDGRITTGSSNAIGQFGFCNTGVFSVYLMSRQRLRLGSDNPLAGVLLISEAEVETGSSNVAGQFVYGEAGRFVKFNSHNIFSGCAGGMLRSETAIVLPTARKPATIRRLALVR